MDSTSISTLPYGVVDLGLGCPVSCTSAAHSRQAEGRKSVPKIDMTSRPTCCSRVDGRHLRIGLLLAILVFLGYVLYTGLAEGPSEREVFICGDGDTSEMVECSGLDDQSCASGAACIRSSCGYKLFPHIDASVAGSSDPYEEDAATNPRSFAAVMSEFYSVVPYWMGFLYLALFLALGDIVPLTRLVVLGMIAVLNDMGIKKFIKQERPVGSCLYFQSFGMPSGHAATSIGLLTYLLLELFVYNPHLFGGLSCCREEGGRILYVLGYGWVRREHDTPHDALGDIEQEIHSKRDKFLLNSAANKLQDKKRLRLLGGWIYHVRAAGHVALLLPVPFSRVFLHDHLRSQVLAGSLIGFSLSSVWYLFIVRRYGMAVLESRNSRTGKWFGLRLGWNE